MILVDPHGPRGNPSPRRPFPLSHLASGRGEPWSGWPRRRCGRVLPRTAPGRRGGNSGAERRSKCSPYRSPTMTAFPGFCAGFLPGGDVSFFNCDIPLGQYYLYSRGIFPSGALRRGMRRRAAAERFSPWSPPGNWIIRFRICPPWKFPWRGAIFFPSARERPVGPHATGNPGSSSRNLRKSCSGNRPPLCSVMTRTSSLPITGTLSSSLLCSGSHRRWRVPLRFDREPTPIRRAIVTEGRSYFTYGQIVYNAPDYPFFGRLHIDRENSFFFSATGWEGIVESGPALQDPIQRLARRSARARPSAPCSSTGRSGSRS